MHGRSDIPPRAHHAALHKQVARVNAAEAEYWRLSQGYRKEESTKVLGFDCGGQQWVLEVAHPMGRVPPLPADGPTKKSRAWFGGRGLAPTPDIDFVDRIRRRIQEQRIPAPCPIEQRCVVGASEQQGCACERRIFVFQCQLFTYP